MGTVSTSIVTTPAVSTTGTLKRSTISDQIRMLFPEAAVLTALVSPGQVTKGQYTGQKGFIKKKSTDTDIYEAFTYTPIAISFTAVSLSSTDLTLGSTSGLVGYYTLVNTANGTTARIDSVDDPTGCTITSFGATAFSVTAGDVLLCMAPAYPQGSSSPTIISKSDDNVYNVVQPVRFPIEIALEAKNDPHYIGNYWERMKSINTEEAMRRIENTLLFSNRPSSGATTSGGTTLTGSFQTMRGLYHWKQNTFDASGSFSWKKFRSDLPIAMGDNVRNNKKYIGFCGKAVRGIMNDWIAEKGVINNSEDGMYKKVGFKSTTFVTDGPDIDIVCHDAFDKGAFANEMLIFCPEDVVYVYKTGLDLKVEKSIQANDKKSVEDEIYGVIGLGVLDGGYGITRCVNLVS